MNDILRRARCGANSRRMTALCSVVALGMVSAGCPSADEAPSHPAQPVVGGKSAAEAAPSGVTRRERSGIDLGERAERSGAASVVKKAAGLKIPPMGQTPGHEHAASALKFFYERWQPAIDGGSAAAIEPLLAEGFKAILPGSDGPVDASTWIKQLASGKRTTGPLEAYPSPGPDGRVTLRYFEQILGATCQVVSRELTL